jgi:hypothetical protein
VPARNSEQHRVALEALLRVIAAVIVRRHLNRAQLPPRVSPTESPVSAEVQNQTATQAATPNGRSQC